MATFSVNVSAAHDWSVSVVVEGMWAMSTLANLRREVTRVLREKREDEQEEIVGVEKPREYDLEDAPVMKMRS
eukprot:EC785470.1.p2 GENE.EC785470.1~~EC785470.1.p2  ORF type:complete len:73 (+),score=21.51 EC785470.1:36-254(+)